MGASVLWLFSVEFVADGDDDLIAVREIRWFRIACVWLLLLIRIVGNDLFLIDIVAVGSGRGGKNGVETIVAVCTVPMITFCWSVVFVSTRVAITFLSVGSNVWIVVGSNAGSDADGFSTKSSVIRNFGKDNSKSVLLPTLPISTNQQSKDGK